MDGRNDAVDPDALGAAAEATAIDGIPIVEQMTWLVTPGNRFDQLTPHPGGSRVGGHVQVDQSAATSTYMVLNVSVGTVNRSAAQRWCAWFRRNVRQVWLDGRIGPRQR